MQAAKPDFHQHGHSVCVSWHGQGKDKASKGTVKENNKIKHKIVIDLATTLLVVYSQVVTGPQGDICTLIFTIALSTIAKRWNEPKCPSMEWRDKENRIYILCSMQPSRSMKFWCMLLTQMNPENIVLSETSQKHDKHYMIPFTRRTQSGHIGKDRK